MLTIAVSFFSHALLIKPQNSLSLSLTLDNKNKTMDSKSLLLRLLLLLTALSVVVFIRSPPSDLLRNPIQSKPRDPVTPRSPETSTPRHPLDPLTVTEINRARSILLSYPPFSSSPSSLVVHSLVLDEPDKPLVRSQPDRALAGRRASVVARFRGRAHAMTVDLLTGEVERLPVPESGYPMMTIEDMTGSTWAPMADARFNRSVGRRGIRMSDVACLPISSGW